MPPLLNENFRNQGQPASFVAPTNNESRATAGPPRCRQGGSCLVLLFFHNSVLAQKLGRGVGCIPRLAIVNIAFQGVSLEGENGVQAVWVKGQTRVSRGIVR